MKNVKAMGASNIFVTAINCMDGRVQLPVIEYMKSRYGLDYVDMVTEPGPNKILAENGDKTTIESIKKRVKISIERHNSKQIAIVGHHDCAGNPADKETQTTHIISAIKTVKSWGLNVQIIGLWVDENRVVSEI
ncbi:MAG: carbonic anhydrase [Thermodesulfobacteriota bacterium]|nr:carbonic anhydrase [Thermodesulfobacteriota bacterium]